MKYQYPNKFIHKIVILGIASQSIVKSKKKKKKKSINHKVVFKYSKIKNHGLT